MGDLPRIYLAIDNCFASKRWTRPGEWMSVVRDLGLRYVEASADTEADPFYCGEEYLADWAEEVARSQSRSGVTVANLYSGHASYTTLGLAHTDSRVRRRIREMWFKPMLRAAHVLGAGLGFYCHAFPQGILQDPEAYAEAVEALTNELAEITGYGAEAGGVTLSLEQMYSPHQIPWTIAGTRELLETVNTKSSAPLYVTIDTGHQTGQGHFARPSRASLVRLLRALAAGAALDSPWLGPDSAVELAGRLAASDRVPDSDAVSRLAAEMDRHPYLFSRREDADPYAWLRSLGSYSPIVHLQQVVGESSSHLPFTPVMNEKGRIHGRELLRSLAESYAAPPIHGLPPRAEKIYLTLEIFAGTAERPREIIAKLEESTAYWRRQVPRDGMNLGELIGM